MEEEDLTDKFMSFSSLVSDVQEEHTPHSSDTIYIGNGQTVKKTFLKEVQQQPNLFARVNMICKDVFGAENLHIYSSSGVSTQGSCLRISDEFKCVLTTLLQNMTQCGTKATRQKVRAAISKSTNKARLKKNGGPTLTAVPGRGHRRSWED